MSKESFLQMNTVFISILVEALPFVVLGVIISGVIQMFITENMLAKIIPKNRFLSVIVTSVLGSLFPACECGIVPITRRLIGKGVPLHGATSFMLTGPVINPVVIFSTYVAFGNDWKMVGYRCILSFIVALFAGWIISLQFKDGQLRNEATHHHHDHSLAFSKKFSDMVRHTLDEFFSVGKFFIIGALIAAAMQTFVKTSTLLSLGDGPIMSIIIMMALAFVLSLCSSADAFVASSFRSTFSNGSLVAFLVFGPMFDIKNMLVMLGTFKSKLVFFLLFYVTIFVFLGALIISYL
ncbi:permease [Priestia endophytica]|uniref:permease n=1 Tax=Priestia endophytica TaxID=135735 RepID=UPI002282EF99|nr:permease [Priestia endophytica]MCY8231944.1 permease [Priestia endophytica]